MGDPGPFTCSFFTPLSTADFLGKPFAWWEVKSWRILHLCWRLFSGLGCFLSFLPNWALCGPNRPLTGRGRVVPPPGVETGQNGPPGGEQGAWVVLRELALGRLFFGFSAGRNARDAEFR